MTEAEWLTSDDPITVLCGLQGRISPRKYTLFDVASAGPLADAVGDVSLFRWLDLAQREAEGELTDDGEADRLADATSELARLAAVEAQNVFDRVGDPGSPEVRTALARSVASSRVEAVNSAMEWWFWLDDMRPAGPPQTCSDHLDRLYIETYRVALPLLRCIVGNPFRPITLDPGWRSPTVVALAEGVYADRAWDRLPILADALDDAGCTHPNLIGHLRGPGPHARGCWVVDLILGK